MLLPTKVSSLVASSIGRKCKGGHLDCPSCEGKSSTNPTVQETGLTEAPTPARGHPPPKWEEPLPGTACFLHSVSIPDRSLNLGITKVILERLPWTSDWEVSLLLQGR